MSILRVEMLWLNQFRLKRHYLARQKDQPSMSFHFKKNAEMAENRKTDESKKKLELNFNIFF